MCKIAAFCCALLGLVWLTEPVSAQTVPQIRLQVQMGKPIREAFEFSDAEAVQMENALSKGLETAVMDGYWSEFCWELSATNATATSKLSVLLDGRQGNWELRVDFQSTNGGGKKVRVATKTVRSSAVLAGEGPPAWDDMQSLLTEWFCDDILEIHRKTLHQHIREYVPVGFGGLTTGGDYAIYILPRFKHFDHSTFRIMGTAPKLEVTAVGTVAEDIYNMWKCIRLTVSPAGMPMGVPAGYQGTAYLVKYVPPSGASGLGEYVLPVDH